MREKEAQAEVHGLLMRCAVAFAQECNRRPSPKFRRDRTRSAALRFGRGLGADESAAFLRALEAGLATVAPDGGFLVPTARACSPNLHLVGRNEDHVAVHTEVLIHVGAYAELVLDGGWEPERLAFDPFTRGAALDLWGFKGPAGVNWWTARLSSLPRPRSASLARTASPAWRARSNGCRPTQRSAPTPDTAASGTSW